MNLLLPRMLQILLPLRHLAFWLQMAIQVFLNTFGPQFPSWVQTQS